MNDTTSIPMDMELTGNLPKAIQEALTGSRGREQQKIAEEVVKCLEILLKKNHDYGGSVWKKPILCPDLDTGTAILVRMSDKIERLRTLLPKDNTPQIEESVEDTMRDLGSYCQLWLARPQEEKEQHIQAKQIEKLNPTDTAEKKDIWNSLDTYTESVEFKKYNIVSEKVENTYYKAPDGKIVSVPPHHNLQIPSDWILVDGLKDNLQKLVKAVPDKASITQYCRTKGTINTPIKCWEVVEGIEVPKWIDYRSVVEYGAEPGDWVLRIQGGTYVRTAEKFHNYWEIVDKPTHNLSPENRKNNGI